MFSIKPGVQSQYRANQDYRSNTCLENVGWGGGGEMGEWIQLLLSITSAELKAGVGEWGGWNPESKAPKFRSIWTQVSLLESQ